MSRRILYFPISAADQARIDPASIQVESGPIDNPDALRLRFTITNPAAGAPRVQPFFAGQMGFLADPGGTLPDETTVFAFTPAEYATWQTRGKLLVNADVASLRLMHTMARRPPLLPNRVAYWPVRLSEAFLYGTCRTPTQLEHTAIRLTAGGKVNTGSGNWPSRAVAGFLTGAYKPALRQHASDPTKDDLQRFAMPTVEMDPVTGAVELWMGAAYQAKFFDDGQTADVDAAATALGVANFDDLAHPSNGALPVWPLLQALQFDMIDADLFNELADKVTIVFPVTPRFFEFRFTLLGRPNENYHCGAFTSQSVRILDSAGSVIQERRIPLHGRVTVSQAPPAAAPPAIKIELPAGPLDPLADRVVIAAASTSRTFDLDFAAAGLETPRLALGPSDLTRYGDILVALGSAPATKTATGTTLSRYEDEIRPAGWPPAGLFVPDTENSMMIFSGSRRPWANMTAEDLNQFFAGLRHVVSSGAPPLPAIRPAEAILVWIMEGKILATMQGFTTPARTQFSFKATFPDFSSGQVAAASAAQIKSLVRARVSWEFWGLDDLNHHLPGQDNKPTSSGDLPTAALNHDAAFEAGRGRMIAAGLNPPTLAEVTDACEAVPSGGDWKFRTAPNHQEIFVWLQHCEYQRRLITLPPNLTPPTNDVWQNPAFGYMAYNGGFESKPTFAIDFTKTVFGAWTDANSRMGAGACTATNPQDALRCQKVTAAEMAMVVSTDPTKSERRGSSRINAMHFSALFDSYARVFPYAL